MKDFPAHCNTTSSQRDHSCVWFVESTHTQVMAFQSAGTNTGHGPDAPDAMQVTAFQSAGANVWHDAGTQV